MRLPENLRDKFKAPLGKLILDSDATKENILKEIPPGSVIITVGDVTSEKIMDFGIIPLLQIVDGKTKRGQYQIPPSSQPLITIECDNPAGEINPKSIEIIQKSLASQSPVQILVNGEEDLLVIPVCIHAPEGAVVMYGQPNEGLVVVHIDSEIKNKTKTLLDLME